VRLHRVRLRPKSDSPVISPVSAYPAPLDDRLATQSSYAWRWLGLLLVGAICAGVFFRFYHLDRKVIWEDELFATVHMLGYTEAEIVEASPRIDRAADLQRYFALPQIPLRWPHQITDPVQSLASEDPQHPPLYYLIGHQWIDRFGSSVTALRSLSAVFGVLVLACMFCLCRELFASRRAGVLGAALVAVSPFHVLYAQEVREYSLWTVALLLLFITFRHAVRRPTTAAWAIYGLTLAGSLYVYPFSGFVALAQGAYAIVLRGGRLDRVVVGYLAAAGAGLALFCPWLAIMIRSTGLTRGMSAILHTRTSPLTVLATLLRNVRSVFIDLGRFQLGPVHSTALNLALAIAVVALAAYAFYVLIRSTDRATWAFIVICVCLPMLPVVARDIVSGGGLTNQSRYFIPLYLGVELAMVGLIHAQLESRAIRTRLAGVVIAVLLLGSGVLSCAVSSQAQTWWNKDYEQNRTVAAVVNAGDHPMVISDGTTSRTLGLGYYLEPTVRLRLNLHCDQCSLETPSQPDLLAGALGPGDIFLLGPSPQLLADPILAAARSQSETHVYVIGVSTFSDRSHALTMFAPIQ